MASGEMRTDEFTQFLHKNFELCAKYSRPGALQYNFMDWRHMGEILSAGTDAFLGLINMCVWCKTSGGMGSLYRSQHELCFIFKNCKESYTNNVQLSKNGRYRTNVWQYAGVNTFGWHICPDIHGADTAGAQKHAGGILHIACAGGGNICCVCIRSVDDATCACQTGKHAVWNQLYCSGYQGGNTFQQPDWIQPRINPGPDKPARRANRLYVCRHRGRDGVFDGGIGPYAVHMGIDINTQNHTKRKPV